MKILIAPDSFKGSISATDASEAIARGWRKVRHTDEISILPLADGGEGTLDALQRALGGTVQIASVLSPDNKEAQAEWLLLADGTAIVELATASGLPMMENLQPLTAHTYGFGQLLRRAATHPLVTKIVATVGGSASTDGGVGALKALGYSFLNRDGVEIENGGMGLATLVSIDSSEAISPPSGGVLLLTDVDNPLLGPRGAAQTFAPQKGATAEEVKLLESALDNFAKVVGANPEIAGSGAAGGAAYGLTHIWGARIRSGSEFIFEELDIARKIEEVDLIITGEGSLDSQSFDGKVIGSLLQLTRGAGKPLWAVVGINKSGESSTIAGVTSLTEISGSPQAAMADAAYWLEVAGESAAKSFSS
jgi:glycerate kinase